MFVDLDWPLNASSPLSASAELLVTGRIEGCYNFRNGTERRNGTTASRSGFYKNMIIYGTERVSFRLLQESYNLRYGTELCSGFYKNMIISGTERRNGTTASRSGCYQKMIIYGTERRNYCRVLGNFWTNFDVHRRVVRRWVFYTYRPPIHGVRHSGGSLGLTLTLTLTPGMADRNRFTWTAKSNHENNVDCLTSSCNSHFYYSLTKAKQSEIRRRP